MTTARDIMNPNPTVVATDATAADAARIMAGEGVGALPICGKDSKIKGVVTDRDLVTKVVAKGRDAGTFPAGDLNQSEAVTVGADDPAEEVLATMSRHAVRRVPVIDGDRLVGMIALADVARTLPEHRVGELVETLAES
ncbi:CBS domain-containing protein [Prauserella cavernicola]|uniref:CBS domain-containing protein n=1 Tax=Prauserella cavernicola TaxID=2800127 RepID=A0A934QW82_9PSEU|nr:CBS domain-containing protein [Prauserella cavernicola]MBK1787671.1 CBS domain-containing protein [Prauserella cavernicola]